MGVQDPLGLAQHLRGPILWCFGTVRTPENAGMQVPRQVSFPPQAQLLRSCWAEGPFPFPEGALPPQRIG